MSTPPNPWFGRVSSLPELGLRGLRSRRSLASERVSNTSFGRYYFLSSIVRDQGVLARDPLESVAFRTSVGTTSAVIRPSQWS
jgi:hypothetical protein